MPRCKFAAWLAHPSSCVAIVGASGWVGMALADHVLTICPDLPPDRLRLLGSSHRTLELGDHRPRIEPLDASARLGNGEWLILHAAIIGGDRVEGGDLQEMRRRNDALLDRVLALADTTKTRRLVAFSSGAVGRPDVGSLDRVAYTAMKRDHETVIAEWARRTGKPVLIPRVFNLGGPFINHTEAYALGAFILALARRGRITIGAADPVFRSFVHVAEMARVILDMAVDETQSADPFDIGGAEVVELGALAMAVGQALGPSDPPIDRPEPGDGPGDWYVGDGRRYQNALFRRGEHPTPLARTVADTVAYLAATGALDEA
ncbi:NAD(P)-dependent oxidoreductase [Caulobacter sp. BK020]|uniref:NAD-dependent epimerase/dehydratase family protein n=1 Tax=Caulobacter sp. BK020 TaxID=2512117 RepID=UPI0010F323F6|nr:NAD(P)-dependent oxidoreductase [Caulobacter sp. BK020]TCS14456.1 nucleoside-diphosphate-sugar epimerase [Caulobacter sp. BK020]